MFDSVFVKCPHCGTENELQTKSGECILGQYSLLSAPPEVILGVEGHHTCEGFNTRDSKLKGCGHDFAVKVQCITKAWIEARLEAQPDGGWMDD